MAHANRVQEVRQAKGMTVSALARAAEISRQTVYSIEGDPSHNVGSDTMRRIAVALGVTLGDLYAVPVEAAAS
jgi:transcriptional regulator with XRE-family HTH domain